MNEDLGDYFARLLDSTFVEYRGFKSEWVGEKLLWKDKIYHNREQFEKAVDDWIREGGEIISNSLKPRK